jgi:hypothetical protein
MNVLRPLLLALPFLALACKETPKPSGANPEGADATPVAAPPPSAPANGTPLPAASVAAFVNPEKLPPYAGPTGSVEGTISITGDPSPALPAQDYSKCPEAALTYGKLFREGMPTAGGGRALADAIVGITGYAGYYVPERSETRTISVSGCAFEPRVVNMTIGQRLEVANKAKDMWAPAIEQAQLPALMVAPPNGDAVKLYPPKPGHMTLIDRMGHPWARSDVWVFMHPLHAVSALDGHYRIDGVPVGKLKVNVRLTAIGQETSKEVEVLAGVVQKVDLTLAYHAPKDAGAPAATDAGPPRVILK